MPHSGANCRQQMSPTRGDSLYYAHAPPLYKDKFWGRSRKLADWPVPARLLPGACCQNDFSAAKLVGCESAEIFVADCDQRSLGCRWALELIEAAQHFPKARLVDITAIF